MPDPEPDDLVPVVWAALPEQAPEKMLTPAGAPTQPALRPAAGWGPFPELQKKVKKTFRSQVT